MWQSPAGKNLYMSIILRPAISPAVSSLITLTAGVAVAESLSAYGTSDVTLKWPNDVLIKGKKVCGILSEMRLKGAEIDFVIVGIGININMEKGDFNESFGAATSLRAEFGSELSRTEVTAKLLDRFENWYGIFVKEGFSPVRAKWIALSGMLGREIVVHSGDQDEKGRVIGLDEDGAILLYDGEGRTERIIAGDVILTEG
jgi:BirA family biotin operon repressor/biotin-[acetyl-CoA-carboxylase] ligase